MGTAVEEIEVAELLMLRECPFCGYTHSSPYADELEEMVLACREHASPEQRGSLEAWEDRDTTPIRPEIEVFSHGAF